VAPADGATVGFRAWGKVNGFIRKGTTLRRDQAETIAVVNLQGSQWGGRYYVNVALWLKALGGNLSHTSISAIFGQGPAI
jgi:hypothetical protein